MRALSACRMSLDFGTETIEAKPIERFNAWTDADGERDRHSPGVIELTPKFFASPTEFTVPLDTRPGNVETQCPGGAWRRWRRALIPCDANHLEKYGRPLIPMATLYTYRLH